MEKILKKIKEKLGPSKDYIDKKVLVEKEEIHILFSEVLSSGSDINEYILKRIVLLSKKQLKDLETFIKLLN